MYMYLPLGLGTYWTMDTHHDKLETHHYKPYTRDLDQNNKKEGKKRVWKKVGKGKRNRERRGREERM